MRPSLSVTGVWLVVTRHHHMGLPVFRRSPLPCMPTPLPRRNRWVLSLSRPNGIGLPRNSGGSASATCLFEACSAFTHVSACMFARSPKVTFARVLQRIRRLLRRPGCFRPSDRLAGWDSHPLEIADFSRHTELMTLFREFSATGSAVFAKTTFPNFRLLYVLSVDSL